VKFFFKGLLTLYNQKGFARIQHGSTANTNPADVWLSRRELIRLYHDRDEPAAKIGRRQSTAAQK
jgi:hypothetical protein